MLVRYTKTLMPPYSLGPRCIGTNKPKRMADSKCERVSDCTTYTIRKWWKKTNSERLHRRKLESQKTRMSDSSEQTE